MRRVGVNRDREGELWKGLAAGAVGGLVAAWTMTQFQALLSKLSEPRPQPEGGQEEADDATVKAASAISQRVFDHALTPREKKMAGPAVHYVFGTAMGALYGAAAELAPSVTTGAGLPFGAALWVAADDVAVPALGLSKAPTEYPLSTHAYGLASHLVYGATTEGVRRVAKRIGENRGIR